MASKYSFSCFSTCFCQEAVDKKNSSSLDIINMLVDINESFMNVYLVSIRSTLELEKQILRFETLRKNKIARPFS